ncbi:MAG: hypothetical protein OEW19_12200 [Acidobacteriota bacterium]|nr:hypothetical protein [Acidobacteriota bacterium]
MPNPGFTLLGVLACLLAVAPARVDAQPPSRLADARQLLLVVTAGWDEVQGELRRFERPATGDAWRPVGPPGAIVVGRSGLAWDPLTTPVVSGPTKTEGDGRSPAGVFPLGAAFGFAPAPEAGWTKLPYLPLAEGIECVDDPASTRYNQIVDRRQVMRPDWTSAERMREIGDYRWGVVIDYNTPPVAGRGSCIFLHIGGEGGRGTAGCTAMPLDTLRSAMAWLDPAALPALVQLPRAAYDSLKASWSLP